LLEKPNSKNRTRAALKKLILKIIGKQDAYISWALSKKAHNRYHLTYDTLESKIKEFETTLGFRILMTNRHQWDTAEIIKAYFGQSSIEQVFKEIKNPFHLACRPQFHWTDHKIRVHYFMCVLGYLLATLLRHQIEQKIPFNQSLHQFLTRLSNIRLGTILSEKKKGAIKALYKLEEMSKDDFQLIEALNLLDFHQKKVSIEGLGVYN